MAPQATCPPISSSIHSSVHFLFLAISVLFCACAWAFPQKGEHGLQDAISKAELENNIKNDLQSSSISYGSQVQLSAIQDPCYPAIFSRNVTSLLREASYLLNRVQDTRERTWLEFFIQRLSYLAEDVQRHPGVHRPECSLYPELLTTSPPGSGRSTNQNRESLLLQRISQRSHIPGHDAPRSSPLTTDHRLPAAEGPESTAKTSAVTKAALEGDDLEEQLRSGPPGATTYEPKPFSEHPHGMIDVRVLAPTTQPYDNVELSSSKRAVTLAPDAAPDANRQRLLGEITSQVHRLRELGGTERDILGIWKQSNPTIDHQDGLRRDDFDDEEQGAAVGELLADDAQLVPTVAPSHIDPQSTTGALSFDPHDQGGPRPTSSSGTDEDDLVRQLQSQKFFTSAGNSGVSRVRFPGPGDSPQADVYDPEAMKRLASEK